MRISLRWCRTVLTLYPPPPQELCKYLLSFFQWWVGIPATVLMGLGAMQLRKREEWILTPVVMMVLTVIFFLATVGEEFQELFDVTGKMKSGLDKVCLF